MKKYKVEYWFGVRSKISHLVGLSMSGRRDGTIIAFCGDGRKMGQAKYKNGLPNGVYKKRNWRNPKNSYFENWKKDKEQGIGIYFKQ